MPRFSANLGFLWPDRPLLGRIDAAAAAGFRAIELHWPYEVDPGAVRERCARHGLVLLGINTVPGDTAAGEFGLAALPGREADFAAAFAQALAWCVAAGGAAIHCMAGKVPAAQRAAACSTLRVNLERAADRAATHGITLLLEPMNPVDAPGYVYSRAEEGAALVAALGHVAVRLMFDCYHEGRQSADVAAALARALPAIGHVQIAAVPSRAEPDEGTLDVATLLATLDRLGYRGWVGCEYRPRGDTDAGLAWMERLGVGFRRRPD